MNRIMNGISNPANPHRRRHALHPAWLLPVFASLTLTAAAAESPDIRRDATVMAVEQVMPGVVNIATKTIVPVRDEYEAFYRQLMRLPNSYISLGSGVMIDESGYLLTNDHVVRRADEIQVQFNSGTNLVYGATVVASDPKTDVALLKLNAPPGETFRAIKFAPEDDLLLGETVLALGNPYGLGGSVTRGILSSKSRTMPKEGEPLAYRNWLQTDAPINRGNSGGPLINLRGELIGINVAVYNRDEEGLPVQGIGFAIPIRLVEEALSDILPTEFVKSFWFGARVKVGSYPLMVTSVQPDSPADKAGLKTGDTILQVNRNTPRSFIEFGELLGTNGPSEVSITLRRGEVRSDVTVRLVPEKSVFNAGYISNHLGLSLEQRTVQMWGRPLKAFVITGVQHDSPAASAHLRDGLLVTTIDGQAPADVTQLAKWLGAKKKGDRVQLGGLTVQRESEYTVFVQDWTAEVALR